MEADKDHIHFLISYDTTDRVCDIVKLIKQQTTYYLWQKATIQKYVESQGFIYEQLHQHLLERDMIHADETPCQVLKEEGKTAQSKSYMWLYVSGNDGLPPIRLYDYQPSRDGYPAEKFPVPRYCKRRPGKFHHLQFSRN